MQFADHGLKTVRLLRVSDPLVTDKLFKQANTHLKCLTGLYAPQKLQNQVIYKIKRTDAYREIKTEEDISDMACQLEALPPGTKARKEKKKTRANHTLFYGHHFEFDVKFLEF